jgi:hypothetical protein
VDFAAASIGYVAGGRRHVLAAPASSSAGAHVRALPVPALEPVPARRQLGIVVDAEIARVRAAIVVEPVADLLGPRKDRGIGVVTVIR